MNTTPQGAHSADPVREAATVLVRLNDNMPTPKRGEFGTPWSLRVDAYAMQLERAWAALRTALAAPEGPAPEPVASALMDNQGELINFHSRKRDFFGALLDDDGYIHDRDDEARADKAAAGRAPHRATLLYAAAPEAPPPVEARQPHNPWRASIENILTGDNYFRAAEWHELLADLDRLYAMPPAVKPLDDPRLQQAFGDAIEGALAFGYQQNNKPPVGHWLNRFWNIGSAEAEKASKPPIVTDEMVTAYLKANDEYWRKVDEIAPPIGVWRNGTPREATRESLRAALAAPAGAGEREALRELIAACDAQDEWRMTPTSLRMNLSAVEAYDIGNRVDLAWTAARAALSVSPPGPEIQPPLDHQVGAPVTQSDAANPWCWYCGSSEPTCQKPFDDVPCRRSKQGNGGGL